MTIIEFARAFLNDVSVAVVITDGQTSRPGPFILYANSAFGALTGRDAREVLGLTPRFMHGRETRRPTLDAFARAIAGGERFHGYLTNYRPDGVKYHVEIDCRPLRGSDGGVAHFVSFQREVTRRIGRPARGMAGRYDAVTVSNEQLTQPLRELGVFMGTTALD